ncbi:MAG: histidine kinase dimerization/phosphoacceptor domain -containing protein [Pseudomonadota bacterium]
MIEPHTSYQSSRPLKASQWIAVICSICTAFVGSARAQDDASIQSCNDALRRDVLTDSEVSAAQKLCLEHAQSLGPTELSALTEDMLRSPYRYLEARDLEPLASRHAGLPRLRLNAIRSGRFRDKSVGVSMADMDRHIAEARRLNDPLSLAYLLYKRAHRSYLEGRDKELMAAYVEEALDLARTENIDYLQRFILSGMGYIAQDEGDMAGAVAAFSDMADIRLPGDTTEEVSWPYTAIGRIFFNLGAADEALRYYEKARAAASTSERPVAEIHDVGLRYETAKAYQALGDWRRAADIYAEALDVAYGYGGDTAHEQSLHDGYARSLYALGNIAGAIENARRAAEFDANPKQRLQSGRTLVWLSDVYLELKDAAAAKAALREAEVHLGSQTDVSSALSDDPSTIDIAFDYAAAMGELLAEDGDMEAAVKYQKSALNAAQNMLERRNAAAVVNAQILFDVRDAEKRIDIMASQAALNDARLGVLRLQNTLSLAITGFVALLAIMIFRSYRAQRALARTKETFLLEIQHRTKNNLQVISSLLGAGHQPAAQTIEGMAQSRTDAMNRIRTMGLVNDHLYKELDRTSTKVNVQIFLQDLLSLLRDGLGRENIDLNCHIAPARIDVDHITPLGLIVCELVTNAYKYAFLSGRSGAISVSLSAADDGLVLSVKDNGCGFDYERAQASANTTGIALIRDLSTQIGGDLACQSGANGTIWRVSKIGAEIKPRAYGDESRIWGLQPSKPLPG